MGKGGTKGGKAGQDVHTNTLADVTPTPLLLAAVLLSGVQQLEGGCVRRAAAGRVAIAPPPPHCCSDHNCCTQDPSLWDALSGITAKQGVLCGC